MFEEISPKIQTYRLLFSFIDGNFMGIHILNKAKDRTIIQDSHDCISDGIKFEMSANNVILSEGDKYNMIKPKYFAKVIDRKSRNPLPYGQAQVRGSTHQINHGCLTL